MFSDNNDNLDNDFLNEFRQRIASSSFDDFEEKEKERAKRAKNIFWGVLSGVVVAGAVGWVILSSDSVAYDENNIPVIRKTDKLVKVKPEQPGGMDIPNRDKEVYEIMVSKKDETPEVEKLLPAAEEPIYPKVEIKESTKKVIAEAKEISESKIVEDIETQVKKIETTVAKKEEADKKIASQSKKLVSEAKNVEVKEVKKAPVAVAVKEDEVAKEVKAAVAKVEAKATDEFAELVNKKVEAKKEEIKPLVAVKSKPVSLIKAANKPISLAKPKAVAVKDEIQAPKEEVKTAKTSAVKGDWQIQLVSSKNKTAVDTTWKTLSKKHNELKGLIHEIEKADLGPKGVYYRLKAGAYSLKSEAISLCNKLKANGGGCIVKQKK